MSDIIDTKTIKQLNPNQKAERFIKLVALKDKINEEFELIRAELLADTQKLGIKQLKTDDYTISRAKRVNVYITDDKEAGMALAKLGVPVKYEKKIASHLMPTIRAMAKDKEIEGIKTSETEYVIVKVNKG